jgi:hypothetical protein
MQFVVMAALPLQRRCFWWRSKRSLPSGWAGLSQCHAALDVALSPLAIAAMEFIPKPANEMKP